MFEVGELALHTDMSLSAAAALTNNQAHNLSKNHHSEQKNWVSEMLHIFDKSESSPTRHIFPAKIASQGRREAYSRIVTAAKNVASRISSSNTYLDIGGVLEAVLLSIDHLLNKSDQEHKSASLAKLDAEKIITKACVRATAQPCPIFLDCPPLIEPEVLRNKYGMRVMSKEITLQSLMGDSTLLQANKTRSQKQRFS